MNNNLSVAIWVIELTLKGKNGTKKKHIAKSVES